jgi:glutamate-1-semialdehyde 2,1-aminomutase
MLKAGASEGDARDHRDYMLRHDAPRWAHLRRCLLEEGIRVVERGLWFLSLAHRTLDLEEAVVRIDRSMKRHKGEWKSI